MTDGQASRYSIIFQGKLIAGASRKAVLDSLAHLTNLSEEELLDSLFSVKPVIITQTDDRQLAEQYQHQFFQAGLDVSTHSYDQSHDDIVNADLNFGHYAPLEKQLSEPNFVLETTETSTLLVSEIQQENGKFNVTFEGQLLDGHDREQVIENICFLTNSSKQEVLDNLFSAIPVIICQTDNIQLAERYKQGFKQTGLKVNLSLDVLLENPETAFRNYLLIRNDKPAELPDKTVQRFTYALYGLAGLAFVCWILIYLVIDSYLENDVEPTIQVQLVHHKVIEKVEPKKTQAKIQPVKKPKVAEKKPVLKKLQKPVKTQQKEVKATPPPEPEKVSKEPVKPIKKKEDKKLQKIKGKYDLQILNWFAQFQQQNPLQSKYVEGEITLRITISRTGEIKNIKVLKSTSEELQRIVVMKFREAKDIPGVPKQITGSEYSFDLPMRYRFK